jgi:colanic acid/amylovoran biosynthesis protein
MIIKVLGIGRPNRGAELMLTAITQYAAKTWPQAQIVEKTASDFFVRAGFFLKRKFGLPLLPLVFCDVPSLIPRPLRRVLGLRADADIDVFLDASGFAYGDAWGVDKMHQRLSYHLPRWQRTGQMLIVLPQAMGPFETSGFAKHLHILANQAARIYVRDPSSMTYLEAALSDTSRFKRAPDFTNLVVPSSSAEKRVSDCAIIPNSKMLTSQTSDEVSYIEALVTAVETAKKLGFQPFFLNHEGPRDMQLITRANAALAHPLPVMELADPVDIKAVLGQCRLVVSARFHGLVSALSQGVPVVAMGWSHKYHALLDEYGMADYLVAAEADAVRAALIRLDENYAEAAAEIASAAVVLKAQVRDMWEEVTALIHQQVDK